MPAKRARSKKAWSGRMAEATHPLVEAFTTSYPIDCRLYPYDIAGSIAHARMLGEDKAASLLDQTLQEESKTNEKLTQLAEGHINLQARDQGMSRE